VIVHHVINSPGGCDEEASAVSISEDPLERKKWMLKLWQEYGERFAVFHPDEQPLPPTEVWHADMYKPYNPEPDENGDFDPRVIRHPRWWANTEEFLRERFGLQIGPDYLFDCLAGKYQGRFSDEIDEKAERRWYLGALRMGAFLFDGKVSVGFSCRSKRCQRIKCALNLQRKRNDQKRLNRVDLFELMQIFYGEEKMSLSKAVREVSEVFGIGLHNFGWPHYAVPKAAVYSQIQRYRKEPDRLIRNFSNLCRRSRIVYFDLKPPTDEEKREHVFLPHSLIEEQTLNGIGDGSVALYLYFWVVRTEEALKNRFSLPVHTLCELEADMEKRGFKIPARTVSRYIERLEDLGLLDYKNGRLNL
jgi:hypothetical protein